MSYQEKLSKLLGREPIQGALEYNAKIMGLKSLEESAKNLFNDLLKLPKEKAKAKKMGLLTPEN